MSQGDPQTQQQPTNLNQDITYQPQQQAYPQQNQQQQSNQSQIIAQQINFDQKEFQQQQYQQQQYQQQQQVYQQQQQYYPQQQMNPQQYPQYTQQNYPQQPGQFVNNDVNQGPPIQNGPQYQQTHIPQGYAHQQSQVYPIQYQHRMSNQVVSVGVPGQEALVVIQDNTLRSADGYQCPVTIVCPTCNFKGQTKCEREQSDQKWMWAIVLCLTCPPFCFIPYVCCECEDIRHYCQNCSSKVGVKLYRCCN